MLDPVPRTMIEPAADDDDIGAEPEDPTLQ